MEQEPTLTTSHAPIRIERLGYRPYQAVWDLQRSALRRLIDTGAPEVLLLCEHPPTITLGKSAPESNIYASAEALRELGVERFQIERGGDVTYHGPGQLVAYPILNLNNRRRDVGWYMRQLEEVVIRTLAQRGLEGLRIAGKTGVWVSPPPQSQNAAPRKIASLGVKISRWCTMHGIALNVGSRPEAFPLEQGFTLINPCGLGAVEITSVAKELGYPVSIEEILPAFESAFLDIFSLQPK